MSFRKLPIALAAASVLVAPVAAEAAPVARSAQPTAGENDLAGSFLWIALAIAAVVGLILVLDDDDSVSA